MCVGGGGGGRSVAFGYAISVALLSDGVAYDEDLADRIRALVADESALTEQKLFGGLAFLTGGNMAVAASGQGGMMVRVDPAESDTLVASTPARPMEMRGKPMQGWLRVDAQDLRTRRQLAKWVGLGTSYARSLAPKRQTDKRPSRRRLATWD